MLVVAGHVTIDPAKREEAIEAARAVMAETRKEPGCRSYVLAADLEDPGRFVIFEEWESAEALRAHFGTPHMAAFQEAMGGFGVRDMQVQRYDVASAGPLRS